jgi:hypothetical protein
MSRTFRKPSSSSTFTTGGRGGVFVSTGKNGMGPDWLTPKERSLEGAGRGAGLGVSWGSVAEGDAWTSSSVLLLLLLTMLLLVVLAATEDMLGERAVDVVVVVNDDGVGSTAGVGVAPHFPKTQPMRLPRPLPLPEEEDALLAEEDEEEALFGCKRSAAMPLRRLCVEAYEDDDEERMAGRAAWAVASLRTAWVVKDREAEL